MSEHHDGSQPATPLQARRMRVLVTGATDGLGEAVAHAVAHLGHHVVVHGRNDDKCARVVNAIAARNGEAHAEVCDFASLADVRALAMRLADEPLDVIVNNAGVWLNERQQTRDGFETTWQVNHLAPFLLTTLLLPRLLQRPDARVVNVSSSGHRAGSINMDDVNLEHGFTGMRAYCQSKLANVLFTQELARRTQGTSLTTHAVHPGAVQTKLLAVTGFDPPAMTAEKSAKACMALVVGSEPRASSGDYWAVGQRTEPGTTDAALANRLWTLSEQQVAPHRG